MVQTKRKLEKRLPLKYKYSSGKMKQKCKLLLLKCSLMVQKKRNQEKVVVTKICFYGSDKIK